jgi:hypothetical protein
MPWFVVDTNLLEEDLTLDEINPFLTHSPSKTLSRVPKKLTD